MMRATWGFVALTVRNLFQGKRGIAAGVLALLPPIVAASVSTLGPDTDGTLLYQGIAFHYTLGIMLFLLALIFGIALTQGEIEDGTVGYLYLGTLPRWTLTLLQATVAGLALTAMVGASVLLTGLAATRAAKNPPTDFLQAVPTVTLIAWVGIMATLGFTMTCGLAFRRPLAVAVIAVFFWEFLVTQIPMHPAAFTVTNNLRALMLHLFFDGNPGRWYRYAKNYDFPDYGQAAMFLSILVGLFLATSMVFAMNRSVEGREAR